MLGVIVWEYAGMGDRMYALASVGYVLDDEGRDVVRDPAWSPRPSQAAVHIWSVVTWADQLAAL